MNFQNLEMFSSNVEVIQMFSREGFNSLGLEEPKEFSKIPTFLLLALSGGVTFHDSFRKELFKFSEPPFLSLRETLGGHVSAFSYMVRQANNSGLMAILYMVRQAKSTKLLCLGTQDK